MGRVNFLLVVALAALVLNGIGCNDNVDSSGVGTDESERLVGVWHEIGSVDGLGKKIIFTTKFFSVWDYRYKDDNWMFFDAIREYVLNGDTLKLGYEESQIVFHSYDTITIKTFFTETDIKLYRNNIYGKKSLVNTTWKLSCIVNIQTGLSVELEPKDCVRCYSLVFVTDSDFVAISSSNNQQGYYVADYETNRINITQFGGTKLGELGDGKLWIDIWQSWLGTQAFERFTLRENELLLYYNEDKNYLLFKSL